jgi:hypothetical protein
MNENRPKTTVLAWNHVLHAKVCPRASPLPWPGPWKLSPLAGSRPAGCSLVQPSLTVHGDPTATRFSCSNKTRRWLQQNPSAHTSFFPYSSLMPQQPKRWSNDDGKWAAGAVLSPLPICAPAVGWMHRHQTASWQRLSARANRQGGECPTALGPWAHFFKWWSDEIHSCVHTEMRWSRVLLPPRRWCFE